MSIGELGERSRIDTAELVAILFGVEEMRATQWLHVSEALGVPLEWMLEGIRLVPRTDPEGRGFYDIEPEPDRSGAGADRGRRPEDEETGGARGGHPRRAPDPPGGNPPSQARWRPAGGAAGRARDRPSPPQGHGRRREICVARKEFLLLGVLAGDPTRVFPKDELRRAVWGLRYPSGRTRTLDSHASRLRRKLDPEHRRFVVNSSGIGYRLLDSLDDAEPVDAGADAR